MTDAPKTLSVEPAVHCHLPARPINAPVRLVSAIFCAVVAVCLAAPLLQTLNPRASTIVQPLEERRIPNPFPSPRLLLSATGDFATGLNQWFDDRVGFRDLFIRAKNQIDFSLFHTSRKVYVGSGGWLFDRDSGIGLERLRPAEFEKLERSFLTLAARLQTKGIRLVVVGYSDKAKIYPDKLPADAPRIPAGGNADKLREFLSRQSTLMFVDAESIMQRERSRTTERLYSRTDMHPTQVGQLPVVKEIIDRIAAAENRPDVRWNEKFEIEHETVDPGNEGRFMSVLFPARETNFPHFKGSYAIGGDEPDGVWNVPDKRVLVTADDGVGRPFDWEFHSRPELCARRLPGMVLFGNSFSDPYWALGLHRYFCFSRRAREPISRFQLFYDTIPPGTKYFIFQYIVPWMPRDAPPMD